MDYVFLTSSRKIARPIEKMRAAYDAYAQWYAAQATYGAAQAWGGELTYGAAQVWGGEPAGSTAAAGEVFSVMGEPVEVAPERAEMSVEDILAEMGF